MPRAGPSGGVGAAGTAVDRIGEQIQRAVLVAAGNGEKSAASLRPGLPARVINPAGQGEGVLQKLVRTVEVAVGEVEVATECLWCGDQCCRAP